MDWSVNTTSGSGDIAMGSQMFLLIAVIIILLQLRTRRVRLWALWITPVILLAFTAPIIGVGYDGLSTIILSAAGFAAGCAVGVLIGTRMSVTTDEQGRMVLKGSLVAVTIWVLVLGLKIYGKSIVGDTGLVGLDDLTAGLLAMTLGSMIARRAYVTLKYLRLRKHVTEGMDVASDTQ